LAAQNVEGMREERPSEGARAPSMSGLGGYVHEHVRAIPKLVRASGNDTIVSHNANGLTSCRGPARVEPRMDPCADDVVVADEKRIQAIPCISRVIYRLKTVRARRPVDRGSQTH